MMLFTLIGTVVYLYAGINSSTGLYTMCLWLGFGIGYWAMFVTIGAEQFGTNVRATAATTIPNMVRGTAVLMTTFYVFLKPQVFPLHSAAILRFICFSIGFIALLLSQNTSQRPRFYRTRISLISNAYILIKSYHILPLRPYVSLIA